MQYNIGEFLKLINGRIDGYTSGIDEFNLLFHPFVDMEDIKIDMSDHFLSKLKSHSRDISKEMKERIKNKKVSNIIADFIKNTVYEIISEDNKEFLFNDILVAIQASDNVGKSSKEKYGKLFNTDQSEFLAQSFLYALILPNCGSKVKIKADSDENIPQYGKKNINDKVKSNSSKIELSSTSVMSPAGDYLIQSGQYNVLFESKTKEDYFNLRIEARSSSIPKEYNSLENYLDYLRFSGKAGEFEICRVTYSDKYGMILSDVNDYSYFGNRIILFDLKVPTYSENSAPIFPCKLILKPPINTEELELVDANDNVLINRRIYRIEREDIGDYYIVKLINTSDEYYNIIITIRAPKNWDFTEIRSINIDFTLNNLSDAYSNLQYYRLLIQMIKEPQMFFMNRTKGIRKVFMQIANFICDNNQFEEYVNLEKIYRKICNVERIFNTHFIIKAYTSEDVSYILLLDKLAAEGLVEFGKQDYTIEGEYEDDCPIFTAPKDDEIYVLINLINDMVVFETPIVFGANYKIVIFSRNIEKIDNDHILIHGIKSIMYNNLIVNEDKLIREVATKAHNILI